MNAIPADPRQTGGTPPPWYRQGWPWFLISIPATSVLLGIMMITLAVGGHDALVVDDWYKEGKGINRRIERDGEATRLGVSARIAAGASGLVLDLGAEAPGFSPPAALEVRWVHVTRAERDGGARFASAGGGRYVADGVSLPEEGRWRIHVEPVEGGGVATGADGTGPGLSGEDAAWRLVSDVTALSAGSSPRLVAAPPGGDRR